MKLSQLAVNEETSFELVNPNTQAPLGVIVHCHTPDSAKWAQLEKKHSNPNKRQAITIGKKGENNKIELDPADAENREKVLVSSVFKIEGIDDLDDSPAAIRNFLNAAPHKWVLEQISQHLGERGNYFKMDVID